VPQPEVERIFEKGRVVRADVDIDRQTRRRVDARGGGVQRQLADRNPHASDAEVAQPEDGLVVRNYHHLAILDRRGAKNLLHSPEVPHGDVDPPRLAIDVTVALARLADRRGVDDRHHLLDVVEEQAVEQRLVAVLQRAQVGVAVDVVTGPAVILVRPRLL